MTSIAAHRARIDALVDRWIAAGLNDGEARQPPFDVHDGCVPPAMWDGLPDANGNVRWKRVECSVTDEDLDRLEARIGVALPSLVRAWLTSPCTGSLESSEARLPTRWSDAPMRNFEQAIADWSPLERAKFVVIGGAGNDVGPLCLDLGAPGREAIVAFDHELLFNLGPEKVGERALVEPLAQPRWSSFAGLLDEIHSGFIVPSP